MPMTSNHSAQAKDTAAATTEDQHEQTMHELDPITVIATKTPKELLDAPGSVSIITEDKINAFSSEHPFKPLHLTEGVWARQLGGFTDYWTRSVFRGQRALVQVDGINWYDYGYYVHAGAIPMSDIERMDVVRGPFSALYGTMAQTAVISYTTKIPEDMEIDVSTSYGDLNSRFYNFRFADRPFGKNKDGGGSQSWADTVLGQDFFYSFSFKSRTSDGYVTMTSNKSPSPISGSVDPSIPVVTGGEKGIDPRTGKERYEIGDPGTNWYEDNGLFFKTGYDFSENTRLWYSLNFSEFEYGWKDGRSYLRDTSGTTMSDGDVYIQDKGDTYALSLNPFLFTSDTKAKESFVHTLHLDHSIPGWMDLTALFGFNDKESTTLYSSSSKFNTEDNSLMQADLTATFHFLDDSFLLTLGTQGVQEKATVTSENLSDPFDRNSVVSTREETNGINRTLGTFFQAEYSPVDSLALYLGGRYDHWWGVDADYYVNIDEEQYTEHSDTDDGQFSPKASLVYHPLENGTIRASYGESFTAPSLYYRTASYYWSGGGTIYTASPSPDLGPITNQSWEVGTEWEFLEKRIRVKATYFENDFEDMIVNKTTTTTLADGTQLIDNVRINSEEATVDGIEAAVEAILPFNLKGGLFYTHNWSEYTKTQADSKLGWEVAETPTDMWSVWIGYFGDRLDASLSYRYCDSRFDDEYAPYADNAYKGDDEYYIMDAKITFRPYENVAVSLAVDNLLDEEYAEFYYGPGRFVLGTLKFSY
jgi:iron complex outermembrane receptor protein